MCVCVSVLFLIYFHACIFSNRSLYFLLLNLGDIKVNYVVMRALLVYRESQVKKKSIKQHLREENVK